MKKAVGRPSKIDKVVLQKLELAFSNGASDTEACFIADISPSTLYTYQTQNPEFLERKEGLKGMLKYRAKANLAASINGGDAKTSQWYLERKAKDEFGQKEIDLKVSTFSLAALFDAAQERRRELESQ